MIPGSNVEVVKGQIKELVQGSVEKTLNKVVEDMCDMSQDTKY